MNLASPRFTPVAGLMTAPTVSAANTADKYNFGRAAYALQQIAAAGLSGTGMNTFKPYQTQYLNELKIKYPMLYADRVQPILSQKGLGSIGMGDDSSDDGDSIFSSILDSVSAVVPSLATAYSAYAKSQGQIAASTAQAQSTLIAAQSGTTWMLVGGAALVAVLLLMRK